MAGIRMTAAALMALALALAVTGCAGNRAMGERVARNVDGVKSVDDHLRIQR
jgi:hypothetical protein